MATGTGLILTETECPCRTLVACLVCIGAWLRAPPQTAHWAHSAQKPHLLSSPGSRGALLKVGRGGCGCVCSTIFEVGAHPLSFASLGQRSGSFGLKYGCCVWQEPFCSAVVQWSQWTGTQELRKPLVQIRFTTRISCTRDSSAFAVPASTGGTVTVLCVVLWVMGMSVAATGSHGPTRMTQAWHASFVRFSFHRWNYPAVWPSAWPGPRTVLGSNPVL